MLGLLQGALALAHAIGVPHQEPVGAVLLVSVLVAAVLALVKQRAG